MLDIKNRRISFDEIRTVMKIIESFNEAYDPTGNFKAYISFEPKTDKIHVNMNFNVIDFQCNRLKNKSEIFKNDFLLGRIGTLSPKNIYSKIEKDIKDIAQAQAWIQKYHPIEEISPLKLSHLHKHIIKNGNLDPKLYMKQQIKNMDGKFKHYRQEDFLYKEFSSHFPFHLQIDPLYLKINHFTFPQMAGYIQYKNGNAYASGKFLIDDKHMISVGTTNLMSEIILDYHLPETIITSLKGKLIDEVIDHDSLKGADIFVSSAKNDDKGTIIKFYDPFVYADDNIEEEFPQNERLKRLKSWSDSKN